MKRVIVKREKLKEMEKVSVINCDVIVNANKNFPPTPQPFRFPFPNILIMSPKVFFEYLCSFFGPAPHSAAPLAPHHRRALQLQQLPLTVGLSQDSLPGTRMIITQRPLHYDDVYHGVSRSSLIACHSSVLFCIYDEYIPLSPSSSQIVTRCLLHSFLRCRLDNWPWTSRGPTRLHSRPYYWLSR